MFMVKLQMKAASTAAKSIRPSITEHLKLHARSEWRATLVALTALSSGAARHYCGNATVAVKQM